MRQHKGFSMRCGAAFIALVIALIGFSGCSSDKPLPVKYLAIEAPAEISEGAGVVAITFLRSGKTDRRDNVTVVSSRPDELTLPSTTVTFDKGQESVEVLVSITDNEVEDGNRPVEISASGSGFEPVSVTVMILDDDPVLSLGIGSGQVSEGAGTVTWNITSVATVNDLVVQFSSNRPDLIQVPASVTIPAGETNLPVDFTIIDDDVETGDQEVIITMTAGGQVRQYVVTVIEDDPNIKIDVGDGFVSEDAGTYTVTVRRTGNLSLDLGVALRSSDLSELTIPASVTIPAGAAAVDVTVTVIQDGIADGDVPVTLTAQAGTMVTSAVLTVLDDELTFLLEPDPDSIDENGGTSTVTITRQGLNIDLSGSVVVTLTPSASTADEVSLPATVTIPAGQASATFVVNAVDDAIGDGDQIVIITASAPGFVDSTGEITVLDDEMQVRFSYPVIPENSSGADLTVVRPGDTTGAATVTLTSSDPVLLPVPATVTIPAGSSSITIVVVPTDNDDEEVTRTVIVTASLAPWGSGSAELDIADDDGFLTYRAIEGRVLDEGEIVSGAEVYLYYRDAQWGDVKYSNTSGYFRFDGLWGDLSNYSVTVE